MKQSVSADARDGDAEVAEKKFEELRELLSTNDAYIRELLAANEAYIKDEGPRLIADAFTAMAQDALNKERPEQAGKLADRALSYVPAHAEALKIISELGPLLALLKLKNDFAEAIKKDNLEDAELILKGIAL
ncbi:MAG: hypothetical protein IPG64_19440 [Haliea sp.]|nr:hypothetical protein [Haliea sp.]